MRRLLLAVLVVLVSCSHEKGEHPAAPQQAAERRAVEVLRLAPTTFETTLRLPGELAPFAAVDIRARVTATIASIAVDRGSRVKRGALLVRLHAPELTAERAGAEARATSDAATYDRLAAAAKTPGAVSTDEVERARSTAEAETARATALRSVEAYTTILAPFDGIITERRVHVGALVTPTQDDPLLHIEDTSHLRLVVALPEHAVDSVQVGTKAMFHVSAFPGTAFEGVVSRPAGSIDQRSRTMAVELDVDNKDGRLPPGAYVEVEWPLKHVNALVVPRTAVVQTTARLFAVRIRNGKVERVDVRRGLARLDDVEVYGDLHEGDLIARRASDDLADGAEVEVKESAPKP